MTTDDDAAAPATSQPDRAPRPRVRRWLRADRLRTLALVVVVTLALALFGAAAGPRWNPDPVQATLLPASESVAVADSLVQDPVGTYETTSRLVQVELEPATADDDAVTTDVLIVEPVGLGAPAPAVVFLHGAGTGLAEAFSEHAQALASAGIVAVSPSKRLDTYSTTQRDYPGMALDYSRSWEMARGLPGVDPDRVGLYAESEGAWVAPILASQQPDVAFLALVSAPVVPPRQQAAFAVDAYLRAVGVPQPLLRAIPRATGAHLPGGILAYADFDVLPYLREVRQPVFMAYGTQDLSMPVVQGPQIVIGALPDGADHLLLRYYEDANHGIRVGSATDPVVPEFLGGLATWILDPAAAVEAGPAIAGATPRQVHLASAVPAPRWYADGEMLLRVPAISAGVLAGGWVLLLLGWAVGAVRRRTATAPRSQGARGPEGAAAAEGSTRGTTGGTTEGADAPQPAIHPRGTHPRSGRALVALTLGTTAVVVALVAYVVAVAQLALSYSTNGVVVWGGWVLLQAFAVIAVWLGVRAGRRLRDESRPATAWGWARLAGCWLVVAGCAGLLVVSAYWGAFSPLS